jgi:outer membrane usher protein FimD/PapC
VADRDLQSCAWFEFSPNGGFDPGRYQVDVYVNGNRYDGQSFNVGQGGGLLGSGGNSAGSAQLGDLYTTTEVDRNGCPTDDAAEFYSDEAVYLSLTESYVPAGTEMYARLSYEGQAVEDTDPIVADRDLQSCVWFVFEPTGRGFDPGRYEAELIVNGRSVDSISFDVR